MDQERYQFGSFELDVPAHKLLRAGERIELPPLSFQALVSLVRAAPESISRKELIEELWPERVVGDETLTERIKLLRQVVEDDATQPELILTERGWGYRFAVVPSRLAAAGTDSAEPWRVSRWRLTAAVLCLLLLGLALVWFQTKTPQVLGPKSLAILPLTNLTGDPSQDYLVAGIEEDLRTRLSRLAVDRLLVMGQSTALGLKSEPALAVEHQIDYSLEGSVRLRGDSGVVAVHLVDLASGEQFWRSEFIPATNPDWQRELVSEVGIALTLDLDDAESAQPLVPFEARDAYLRGRYEWRQWSDRGFSAALTHYERALELAPDYAEAHSGLADALGTLAYHGALELQPAIERSRYHAARALELKPESATALASNAMLALFFDHDGERAGELLDRVLTLAPNNADYWFAAANLSWARGCETRGVFEAQQAVRIDPHSPILRSALALSHLFAGDNQLALSQARLALEWRPGYPYARYVEAMALQEMGRTDEALDRLASSQGDEMVSALGYVLAKAGRADEARALLDRVWSDRSQIAQARLLAAVGESDAANAKLDQALNQQIPAIVTVSRYPSLRAIPRSPRLERLVTSLSGDCP